MKCWIEDDASGSAVLGTMPDDGNTALPFQARTGRTDHESKLWWTVFRSFLKRVPTGGVI